MNFSDCLRRTESNTRFGCETQAFCKTSWLPRLRGSHTSPCNHTKKTPNKNQRLRAHAGGSGLAERCGALGWSWCPASSTQADATAAGTRPGNRPGRSGAPWPGGDKPGANRTNCAALVKCVCPEWQRSECCCGPLETFSQPVIKSEGANPSTWGGGSWQEGGAKRYFVNTKPKTQLYHHQTKLYFPHF